MFITGLFNISKETTGQIDLFPPPMMYVYVFVKTLIDIAFNGKYMHILTCNCSTFSNIIFIFDQDNVSRLHIFLLPDTN